MSVKGFSVDGGATVHKYDYTALDSKPGYFADSFSTSSTYAVDDYVMYNNQLYRCTTAVTTAGAWDSTKWTAAVLGDEISSIKGDLSQITTATSSDAGKVLKAKTVADEKVTEWEFIEADTIDNTLTISGAAADAKKTGDEIYSMQGDLSQIGTAIGTTNVSPTLTAQDGYYWNIETTTAVLTSYSDYTAYEPIAVTPGTKYYVNIYVAPSGKQNPVVFVDSNYTVLSSFDDDHSQFVDFEVTAPANAAYALLTTITSKTVTFYHKEYNSLSDVQEEVSDLVEASKYDVSLLSQKQTDKYWNISSSPAVLNSYSDYVAYTPIEVTPGTTYKASIFAATSSRQRPLVFVDTNYGVLTSYDGTHNSYVSFEVVAPTNAKYALITTKADKTTTFTTEMIVNLHDLAETVSSLEWKYLENKTVAIIGDSISTNGNPGTGTNTNAVEITIEDEDVGVELSAYLTYYDVNAGLTLGGHTFTSDEIGTEVTFTPVAEDVGKVIGLPNNYNANNTTVWWEVAKNELGFTPIPVCWSGASVTSHETSVNTLKTSYAWHDAQIRKCGIRTAGTMTRTAPDVIIVYRGTNDFSHTPYTKLTDDYFSGSSWTYPDTDAVTDGYGYKEGLCLLVKKLRTAYPNATIFLCTLNVFKRVNYSAYPTNNGINTLPEYNNAIREVADYLGCGLIEFDKDGITFENCYSGGYITDSSTTPTHPADKGHEVMGKKAIADIKSSYAPL